MLDPRFYREREKGKKITAIQCEFERRERDVRAQMIRVLQLHAYACALFIIFFCLLFSPAR